VSDHIWHSSSTVEYQFDWKIYMEIFLDLYHVNSYHPGLRSSIDCNTFEWILEEGWCCQTAEFSKTMSTIENYSRLFDIYKESGLFNSTKYGAIWLGIYPNTMIEYYPGAITVSTVWPTAPGKCVNFLDWYYEKDLVEKFPDFPEIQQKAFIMTADEDEEIGMKLQKGVSLQDKPFVVKNHPVEEAGFNHFHKWLKKHS
jgi:choline monooxygenase